MRAKSGHVMQVGNVRVRNQLPHCPQITHDNSATASTPNNYSAAAPLQMRLLAFSQSWYFQSITFPSRHPLQSIPICRIGLQESDWSISVTFQRRLLGTWKWPSFDSRFARKEIWLFVETGGVRRFRAFFEFRSTLPLTVTAKLPRLVCAVGVVPVPRTQHALWRDSYAATTMRYSP